MYIIWGCDWENPLLIETTVFLARSLYCNPLSKTTLDGRMRHVKSSTFTQVLLWT